MEVQLNITFYSVDRKKADDIVRTVMAAADDQMFNVEITEPINFDSIVGEG